MAGMEVEGGFVSSYGYTKLKGVFKGDFIRIVEHESESYVLTREENQTSYTPVIDYKEFPVKDFEDYDI